MKKYIYFLLFFFSLSTLAETDILSISYPDRNYGFFTVDCSTNTIEVYRRDGHTVIFNLAPQLSCSYVDQSITLASATDDVAGTEIQVQLTFDLSTSELVNIVNVQN